MQISHLAHRHSLNVVTVALGGLAVWRLGFAPELPAVLAFVVGGVLLSAIDWRVRRLPTRIVYATLAAVAAGLVFAAVVEGAWSSLGTAALGGVLFANAFYLVWLLTVKYAGLRVLGLGDVRLAAVLGLLLGWWGLPFVLYGAIVGHLLALAVAAATYARDRRVQLIQAFGPPLIAGAFLTVLVGA